MSAAYVMRKSRGTGDVVAYLPSCHGMSMGPRFVIGECAVIEPLGARNIWSRKINKWECKTCAESLSTCNKCKVDATKATAKKEHTSKP
jgi:hypothetical protein